MASLSEFPWKFNYASDEDDLVQDFYLPALERADRYDRAVGFFSSSALALISPALDGFVRRGGRMRVLASPKNLPEEDLQTIVRAESKRALERSLRDALDEEVLPEHQDQLALLAWMIEHDRLDVRIAVRVLPDGRATLYHKKVGVMACLESGQPSEWLTFTGSPNETAGGLVVNAEAFPVHRSWVPGQREYAENEKALFDTAWAGDRPQIWTWTATQWLRTELRERFGVREPRAEYVRVGQSDLDRATRPADTGPALPAGFDLRGYQKAAVKKWMEQGGRGTFAMATGTGKTETALAAAVEAAEVAAAAEQPLLVLVIVPLTDLVAQWSARARKFGFRPLSWHGASGAAERQLVREAFRGASLGRANTAAPMVITTADSLVGAGFADLIEQATGNLLVIGDEMHSLGTQRRLQALPAAPTFTLGLSATPKRHHDDAGTEELLAYFGGPVISISIRQAIYDLKALTPYNYHLHFAALTDSELSEFRRLSKLVAGAMGAGRDADPHLRARSNLVAHAEGKFEVLTRLMGDSPWTLKDANHQIVYVGEGRARDATVTSIERVTDLLGHRFGMTIASYTSETPAETRAKLQTYLGSGELQALIAMKCLDEGVDIPEVRMGVMLASTQNPRQFVQRRGRILRQSAGKTVAELHDVLMTPDTSEPLSQSDETLAAAELSRAYELADAAENRVQAMHAVRVAAIDAGLFQPDYPWMRDIADAPMDEWTGEDQQ